MCVNDTHIYVLGIVKRILGLMHSHLGIPNLPLTVIVDSYTNPVWSLQEVFRR